MASTLHDIETAARQQLEELKPSFWTSDELIGIINRGIKDLWRATVDLKQEHYLKINTNDVKYPADTDQMVGLPNDVHKVYLVEALNNGDNDANRGLVFTPKDYNHDDFRSARTLSSVDPTNEQIYYAITSQGGPVGQPIIYCAPQVTSEVSIRFCYVPTLGLLASSDIVPIPGESDNALIAWTLAFARAKERENKAPDESQLAVYSTEKQQILQSLGLRQYQEPQYVEAVFASYW